MKKKVVIPLLVVLSIVILAGVYLIGNHVIENLLQEGPLKKECIELTDLLKETPLNYEAIDEKTATTISQGDYAVVEQAYKQYVKDGVDNIKEIVFIATDEKILELLSIENYEADSPDFTETKEYIQTMRERAKIAKLKFVNLDKDETIMSYISDKDLNERFVKMYKEIVAYNMGEANNDDKTVENTLDLLVSVLDGNEKVIDFLIENQGKWQIENDKIFFENEDLLSTYKAMFDELINLSLNRNVKF